jgi:antitoxin (DNA-binding transcriptional repressor) of toxin-antitoxin stability system
MTTIALFDAKNRLSELIDRVQAGETFAITRRGKVVASLGLPQSAQADQAAQDAVARVRASRHGVSLGGLSSRSLMAEGRR